MSSGLMSTRPLERICPSLPNSAKSGAFTRAAVADGYTVQNDEWLVISR